MLYAGWHDWPFWRENPFCANVCSLRFKDGKGTYLTLQAERHGTGRSPGHQRKAWRRSRKVPAQFRLTSRG